MSCGAVPGLCVAEAFPCAGWVRDAQLPTSPISNTTHPSNANTQKLEIPRKICLPQCETTACTGKGNLCPVDPKYCGICKEKGNGEYAMHFIRLVWQNLGYLTPSVRRYLPAFWALKIFPKPVSFRLPTALGGGVGVRVQPGVEQAESISRFPSTLFEPHLVFVSAADTSSEMHPSLLD